jgi:starch phosphorylase
MAIRYDHGLFRQILKDGWQKELPGRLVVLRAILGSLRRPEVTYDIHFGGWVETIQEPGRAARQVWEPEETIQAAAYDTPVVAGAGAPSIHCGCGPLARSTRCGSTHSTAATMLAPCLSSHAPKRFRRFSIQATRPPAGRELRLRQEYFFVSASLQDLVARHLRSDGDLHFLPQRAAIQLNDTHPSVAIAELMRLLTDVHGLPWKDAWQITVGTFSYTNHTLLPEALETWPLHLFERVLPRHLQIIYRINAEHIEAAKTQGPGRL